MKKALLFSCMLSLAISSGLCATNNGNGSSRSGDHVITMRGKARTEGMLLAQPQPTLTCGKALVVVALTTMFGAGMVCMGLYGGGGIH